MDRIELRGLRVRGHHGVLDSEAEHGQVFTVDLALEVDLERAAENDTLEDTVDYGILAARIADAVATTRFRLIEALAGHLARLALEDPRVVTVEVRVGKPHAPVAVDLAEVAVTLHRTRQA